MALSLAPGRERFAEAVVLVIDETRRNRIDQQLAGLEINFQNRPFGEGDQHRPPARSFQFQEIAGASDRVLYEQLGTATEGQPFVLLTISSPENLRRLDRYREI